MKGKIYNLREIFDSPLVAIDIESAGLNRRDEIISAAVTWLDKKGEISSVAFFLDRYSPRKKKVVEEDDGKFKDILSKTLFNVPENGNGDKDFFKGIVLFHNLLFDLKLLMVRYRDLLNSDSLSKAKEMPFTRYRFLSTDICKVADTASMSRLLKSTKFLSHIDPNKFKCHSLKFLAKEYFPSEYTDDPNEKDSRKKKVTSFDDATLGLNIRLADRDRLLDYNMEDTELTLRLYNALKQKMNEKEWAYFEKFEVPHSLNLFHLAWYGVPFDSARAEKLISSLYKTREILMDEIYRATGTSDFNIDSQQQLSKYLFYNQRITFQHPSEKYPEPISPFGGSETGAIKIDSDTLKSLQARIKNWDKKSNFIPLVDKVIAYLELSKNISKIENLEKYVVRDEEDDMIFPNISASTKSGRISCSGPNVLGLPKSIFKKSTIPSVEVDGKDPDGLYDLWTSLKNESVRSLIKAPLGFKIARIDISGLDLVVLAQGAKKFSKGKRFYWLEFLEKRRIKGRMKVADTHFSILQKLEITFDGKDIFKEAFAPFHKQLKDKNFNNYLAMKPSFQKVKKDDTEEVEGIEFIHTATNTTEFLPYPADGGITKGKLKTLRDFSKKLNLATSYLMGAVGLAMDLTEVIGKAVPHSEAKKILDRFYEVFAEIQNFQDEVSNEIYRKGYMESPFGRRFYAETWDDLNEYHRQNPDGEYELILFIEKKFWYLKARGWVKFDIDESPIISGMKIIEKPFGLEFKEILEFELLESKDELNIFRPKEKKRKKSKFSKKSEDNLDEQTKYELNRIEITSEVKKEIALAIPKNSDRSAPIGKRIGEGRLRILGKRISDNGYLFKENEIRFYKVKLQNPASRYFKEYNKLLRSAKVFFPMYCQGVANTVAITVLTRVRERFEKELPDARMLFFIHDEVVALVPDNGKSLKKAREILTDAVENENIKKPFDLPFSGEFEERDTFAE